VEPDFVVARRFWLDLARWGRRGPATGAYLLKMAGTDFVAWSAIVGAVEMRR